MVMAQSLFIDIKAREPDARIDVLAPTWSAALIDRMPQVSQLVSVNFKHGKLSLRERFNLGKHLRTEAYTNAIVLPNSFKSALVPAIAKIPTRTGFIGEQRWGLINDIRKLNKESLSMTVQRFISLGLPGNTAAPDSRSLPAPQLEVTPGQVSEVLEKNNLNTSKPILVLCPGAEFGASKQWPDEHYARLANHYLELGWQVWLLGSDKDLPICSSINNRCQQLCQTLAGKTTLPEAIDLISNAKLVVSNDSGLMHIAAALGIPLVAIYGSTDPSHTPPLSNNHSIARLNLDCSPCFKRECPLQHLNCLRQLMPAQVIELADQQL